MSAAAKYALIALGVAVAYALSRDLLSSLAAGVGAVLILYPFRVTTEECYRGE